MTEESGPGGGGAEESGPGGGGPGGSGAEGNGIEGSGAEPGATEKTGTFVVTHAAEGTAVLQDAADGQVHALEAHPDLAEGEVVAATLRAVPPMEVAWEVAEVDDRWTVTAERSAEPPTGQAREAAADQPEGELTRIERAGTGELHVITVPAEATERAAADVLDDEAGLVARAARLGVGRVEVRAADGVVSVRYLP